MFNILKRASARSAKVLPLSLLRDNFFVIPIVIPIVVIPIVVIPIVVIPIVVIPIVVPIVVMWDDTRMHVVCWRKQLWNTFVRGTLIAFCGIASNVQGTSPDMFNMLEPPARPFPCGRHACMKKWLASAASPLSIEIRDILSYVNPFMRMCHC